MKSQLFHIRMWKNQHAHTHTLERRKHLNRLIMYLSFVVYNLHFYVEFIHVKTIFSGYNPFINSVPTRESTATMVNTAHRALSQLG